MDSSQEGKNWHIIKFRSLGGNVIRDLRLNNIPFVETFSVGVWQCQTPTIGTLFSSQSLIVTAWPSQLVDWRSWTRDVCRALPDYSD